MARSAALLVLLVGCGSGGKDPGTPTGTTPTGTLAGIPGGTPAGAPTGTATGTSTGSTWHPFLDCKAQVTAVAATTGVSQDTPGIADGRVGLREWESSHVTAAGTAGVQVLAEATLPDPFGIEGELRNRVGNFDATVDVGIDDPQCDLDQPWVIANYVLTAPSVFTSILMRAGADPSLVIGPDTQLGGQAVTGFGQFDVGTCGELAVWADLADGRTVMATQADAGDPLREAFTLPLTLRGSSPRTVGGFLDWWVYDGATYFEALVVGGTAAGDRVLGAVEHATGDVRCLATTDPAVDCGLYIAPGLYSREAWSTDGSTTAVQKNTATAETIEARFESGATHSVSRGDAVDGYELGAVTDPLVCRGDHRVYFRANLWDQAAGLWDEILVLEEDGTVARATDFRGLLDQAASISGEIPDEIKEFSVGANCELVIYGWGPSSYEGLWAQWPGHGLARVYDQRAGGSFEVGGVTHTVGTARVSLGTNSVDGALPPFDAEGRLGMYLDGTPGSVALVAERNPYDCHAPNVVNSTGDGPDLHPGDNRCDTGGTVGAEPECTLRAAIEEANALTGLDLIRFDLGPSAAIQPGTTLPIVDEAVRIDTEGADLELDGNGLAGPGLAVGMDGVTIRGLAVRGFGGHGIESGGELVLEGVDLTQNCGWGVYATAPLVVRGGLDGPTTVIDNGSGSGCEAGGILAQVDDLAPWSLELEDVEIRQNNGPGVLANASVRVARVGVHDNLGDGLSIDMVSGDAVRTRLWGRGPLEVTGNSGHGLSLGTGGLFVRWYPWTITGNGGWGVLSREGRITLGVNTPTGRSVPHVVSDNGVGSSCRTWTWGPSGPLAEPFPCGGGGIGVLEVAPEPGFRHMVSLAEIADNAGPGVIVTDEVTVRLSTLARNQGPGVATVFYDSLPSADAVRIELDSTIQDNLGNGVDVEDGTFKASEAVTASGNLGWGIRVEDGEVDLGWTSQLGFDRTISGNGDATATCHHWGLDPAGLDFVHTTAACDPGGVLAEDGSIRGVGVVVFDNAGPGLQAGITDDGAGDVQLTGGAICNNAPDLVAAGTQTLTGVGSTCP